MTPIGQIPGKSNMPEKPDCRPVRTTLNFIKVRGDGSDDFVSYMDKPETHTKPCDNREVTVFDVSGHEEHFTLEQHGFQWLRHASGLKDFDDERLVKEVYYAESEKLLSDLLGVKRVVAANHKVRYGDRTGYPGQPCHKVHFDSSIPFAHQLVHDFFPAEAVELFKSRVVMVNIWRPLAPVLRDPLCVGEAHSVPPEDEITITIQHSTDESIPKMETNEVRHGKGHNRA
ncbi:hydroxylase/desaturase asaB [Colletotrichum liriopes]|uniref:Hydroxylase/desaturase asaB n=1 Tax=Colletotrichum liriopes TaxID=708192 RepID=A0AA37GZU6_9PEZI|nr:hydroxylase/desaturase asaB [Colletotrichum liriopes]